MSGHHPSCKPDYDRQLIWKCGQCGLEEFAENEILGEHLKELAAKDREIKTIKEAIEPIRGFFRSGNNIPIERAVIKADLWNNVEQALNPPDPGVK